MEEQVKTGFSSRISAPVSFEYFTCVISEGLARDTESSLAFNELVNFAKIQTQCALKYSQYSTTWFISLTKSAETGAGSTSSETTRQGPASQVKNYQESERAERVMMHLSTIYKVDAVYLPIKSKVLGKALMDPLVDTR